MQDIGVSREVKSVIRLIGEEGRNNISSFYSGCLDRKFEEYSNLDMALMSIDNGYVYSETAKDVFTNYSGFNYRRINAAARNTWNYDEHGHINEKPRFDRIAYELKNAIDENQNSVGDIKVFRGVPLNYFSDYGISTLSDLDSLKGGFLLDKGFVSTSLTDDTCYYKKENELGLNYNVKIEYLVPKEFEDGVSISNVSYSPNQGEYLINSWNLAQVVEVSMDGNDGAIIQAMLIPKKVYDKSYDYKSGNVK